MTSDERRSAEDSAISHAGRASPQKSVEEASLFFLAKLAFERVLGTRSGFGKIAVRAFDQRMLVAMGKLACHRVVSGLFAFVGFERTVVAVGIVLKMITNAIRHGIPLDRLRYLILVFMTTGRGYTQSSRGAITALTMRRMAGRLRKLL